MASARQRSRKHARRVHHVRAQRARLRAALADVLAQPVTMTVLRERMYERGYYQHTTGRWKRRQSDPYRRGTAIKVARHGKKRRK